MAGCPASDRAAKRPSAAAEPHSPRAPYRRPHLTRAGLSPFSRSVGSGETACFGKVARPCRRCGFRAVLTPRSGGSRAECPYALCAYHSSNWNANLTVQDFEGHVVKGAVTAVLKAKYGEGNRGLSNH
jgi:hypothetical protein